MEWTLIKCKTCQRDIGDSALRCVHCGANTLRKLGIYSDLKTFILLGITVITATLLIGAYFLGIKEDARIYLENLYGHSQSQR
jgi:hypothetical protein